MPESLPPPLPNGESGDEPGWYPDPNARGVLRWWDGTAWSDADVKPAGEYGIPAWHPGFLRERARAWVEELTVRLAARFTRG